MAVGGTIDIPYPSPAEVAEHVRERLSNRIARVPTIRPGLLGRVLGPIGMIMTPSPAGTNSGMANPGQWLSPGQLDWARRQSEARDLPEGWLAQELANRQRHGLTQDPDYEMSQSEYDEAIENVEEGRDIAVANSSAQPTPGNVRITAALEALLGACATLGCLQPPVDGYGGGAHGCMRQPSGDGLDSHHMPADRYSPIPREMAPAIRMDPHDHTQTDSYGGGVHGPRYAGRRALLARGMTMAAFNRDAAEIEQKFPGKYTASIAQARAYAECLRQAGAMR